MYPINLFEFWTKNRKNDTWFYTIPDPSTKTISFEVVVFDYSRDEDTLIRVNEIVAKNAIVSPRINGLASLNGFVICIYVSVLGITSKVFLLF